MNPNPIFTGAAGATQPYSISADFKDSMICLTIEVALLDDGWKYQGIHVIYLGPSNLFPDNRKEPVDLKLGYAKDLHGKVLAIRSRIDRIRNGSNTSTPSRVKYTLKIKAGDTLLDTFEQTCGPENPEEFFAQLKFKLV